MLEEFCQAPLCLELDVDSYEGDWKHVARFRGRSGWFLAAKATLQSETEIYRTVIAVACDECGNPIPSFQAAHLLECNWTKVEYCAEEPPALLGELLCEEEGSVYARWQRATNEALQRHLADTDNQIATLERAAQLDLVRRLREIDEIKRRRRMPGLTDEARIVFNDVIMELEAERDAEIEFFRSRIKSVRQAADDAEEALWQREDVLIELTRKCVAQWSAPTPRTIERDPTIRAGAPLGAEFTHGRTVARWSYAAIPETKWSIDAKLQSIHRELTELEGVQERVQLYEYQRGEPSFFLLFGYGDRREAIASCRSRVRELEKQRAAWNKLRKEVE